MAEIPILCHGCGATGSVQRVTAALQCKCGSNDLDIWDGQKTAASPGTGWTQPHPNTLEGWDQYEGPAVGRNPLTVEDAVHDDVTPESYKQGNPDYIPGGGFEQNKWPSDVGQAPEIESYDKKKGPESGGARWQGKGASLTPLHITLPDGTKWEGTGRVVQSGRKSSDPMGSAEQYVHDGYKDPTSPGYRPPAQPSGHPDNTSLKIEATCPNCRNPHTTITRDHKDDGWWACPKCGPLANVDKNPSINPLSPPIGFTPDRSMKQKAAKFRKVEKTGQLFKMVATIKDVNTGISTEEALTLSRRALLKWGSN
jgi:hypothetical protein